MSEKSVVVYVAPSGKEPFTAWLRSLDRVLHLKVLLRLERVSLGNFGDHKSLSGGISELRFREGLRISCTEGDRAFVLLLTGGDKNTKRDQVRDQVRDIDRAREYLQEYGGHRGG